MKSIATPTMMEVAWAPLSLESSRRPTARIKWINRVSAANSVLPNDNDVWRCIVEEIAEEEARSSAAAEFRRHAEYDARVTFANLERLIVEEEARMQVLQEVRLRVEKEAMAKAVEEAIIEANRNSEIKVVSEAIPKAQDVSSKGDWRARVVEEVRLRVFEESRIDVEGLAGSIDGEDLTVNDAEEAIAKLERGAQIDTVDVTNTVGEERRDVDSKEQFEFSSKESIAEKENRLQNKRESKNGSKRFDLVSELCIAERISIRVERSSSAQSYGMKLSCDCGAPTIVAISQVSLAEFGVKKYDVLMSVNGEEVWQADRAQVIKAISSSNVLDLVIARFGQSSLKQFKQLLRVTSAGNELQVCGDSKEPMSGNVSRVRQGSTNQADEKQSQACKDLISMKTDKSGNMYWEVVLAKTSSSKFGCLIADGKKRFVRDLAVEHSQESSDSAYWIAHKLSELRRLEIIPSEDAGPEVLTVKKITRDGLIHAWNLDWPEFQVREKDMIYEVNGKTSVHEMWLELRSKGTGKARMKMLRYPPSFHATLCKNISVTKLGLKCVRCTDVSNALRISTVKLGSGGAVDEYNKACIAEGRFGEVLTVGMLIEGVNSEAGDPHRLFKEITTADTVRLRIRRDTQIHHHSKFVLTPRSTYVPRMSAWTIDRNEAS